MANDTTLIKRYFYNLIYTDIIFHINLFHLQEIHFYRFSANHHHLSIFHVVIFVNLFLIYSGSIEPNKKLKQIEEYYYQNYKAIN